MSGEGLRQRYGSDLLAVASLLLLLALRFLPTLITGRLYAPFNDNVYIYGPMFSETARIALHGEYPFYLPSFGTGFPLYQSPHYSPAYPFYFFGLLDYGGPLQSLYTLTYLAIFHRVILALNFFVLLRCARISPWASFVGASLGVFAYNSEMYSAWITIASSYTWIPLVLAGGVLLLQNPRSIAGILLLGVSAGLLMLASASQSVAHALFCCLIFFTSGAIWLFRKGGRRPVLQLVVSLVCAGVIASCIGAVSAVPVYLGIKNMVRHIGNAAVIGHEKIPWAKFNQMQLGFGDLPCILLNPGKIEIVGSPYVGPLGLLGVVFAVWFFPRLDSFGKLLAMTIGAIGLYGLLSAFGTHFGLAYLNYYLPFLNKIREAGRNLVLFVLGVVFLSGIGFDQLGRFLNEEVRRQKYSRALLFTAGIICLFFLAVVAWELSSQALLVGGRATILLLAPLVLILGLLIRPLKFGIFAFAALLVSLAAWIAPVRTSPVSIGEYSKSSTQQALQTLSDLRNKIPPGDFRIDFVDKRTNPFTWTMIASYFDYRSFYNRLTPQPYDQVRFSLLRKPPGAHEIMGSRYVLCAPNEKPYDPAATARFALKEYTVFENPAYMDRVTFVHSLASAFSNETKFLARVRRGLDFRRAVCLQDADVKRLTSFVGRNASVTAGNNDQLNLAKNSVNRVVVQIKSSRPGVAILNEWYSSAWHVRINGRRQATVRANQWQVGVPVLAGRNNVEFIYRPTIARTLLLVSWGTWLVLVLGALGIAGWKIRARTLPEPST